MASERVQWRQLWRRSNATAPRRNKHRERKSGQEPWNADDFRDSSYGEDFDDLLGDYIEYRELGEK